MDFEWDEAKRLANLEERGVDFRHVVRMFEGAVIEAEDTREDYGERRFRALGQVGGVFFMVAYTWRGAARRIISAWRVDDDGQRRYAALLARNP